MNLTPEILALSQSLATCRMHQEALQDALTDLTLRKNLAQDLENPGKLERRLLDQFAYRYTRLQDDMGAKLIPAILRALGEEIEAMPMLDRLNRMEQLGWLPSADEWIELRRIRNEFVHDYPDTVEERFARFLLAMQSAEKISLLLQKLADKLERRFPDDLAAPANFHTPPAD